MAVEITALPAKITHFKVKIYLDCNSTLSDNLTQMSSALHILPLSDV